MAERSITVADLMARLPEVLEEIVNSGSVFLVGDAGGVDFVLGPVDVLWGVCGLIDPEYGWPQTIPVADVKEVGDLAPGHRRHPVLVSGEKPVAMSISPGEYELLKAK